MVAAFSRTWWSRPGLEVRERRLAVAGRDAEDVARTSGTPAYVYDLTRIEEQASAASHLPGDGGWLGVGDGAVRYRAQLEAAGVVVPPERSPLHALDGGAICELGAMASPALRYEELLPDYRRTPDVARSRSTPRSEPLAAGAGAPR